MAIELDELRQELKERAGLDHSIQPESNSAESTISSQSAKAISTQPLAGYMTQTETAHSTSSAEYLVSGIKSHKSGALLALLGAAVIIAVSSARDVVLIKNAK